MNRIRWMRLMRTVHWVSSAICLLGLVLFSLTGITLNHSDTFTGEPTTASFEATLDPELAADLAAGPADGFAPLPEATRAWLAATADLDPGTSLAEWNDYEVYFESARPGRDLWLAIDRATGEFVVERTDYGWIAWLNDLHKGRDAGLAWKAFIDVFAVATLIFAVTGLILLYLLSPQRRLTWPLTAMGLVLPALLLVFVH